MSSETAVANAALRKMGAARLSSIDDATPNAILIKECFGDLRDEELRAHRWQFSLWRASLPALSTAPAFGYSYQYQVPSDFLRLDMVNDRYPSVHLGPVVDSERVDYVLEGNLILTNLAAPLKIRYIRRIEDVAAWDVCFRDVLACRIMMETCDRIIGSTAQKQFAAQVYSMSVSRALRAGAIERLPIPLADDAWIVSRL